MYKQPENQAYEVPLCERLDVVPLDARLIIEHKQPEALRLADEMEENIHKIHWNVQQASDELRRLHSLNQELVDALTSIAEYWNQDTNHEAMADACHYMTDTARATLAKHKEQA